MACSTAEHCAGAEFDYAAQPSRFFAHPHSTPVLLHLSNQCCNFPLQAAAPSAEQIAKALEERAPEYIATTEDAYAEWDGDRAVREVRRGDSVLAGCWHGGV